MTSVLAWLAGQIDRPGEAARTLLWLHELPDLRLGLAQGERDVEDREAVAARGCVDGEQGDGVGHPGGVVRHGGVFP